MKKYFLILIVAFTNNCIAQTQWVPVGTTHVYYQPIGANVVIGSSSGTAPAFKLSIWGSNSSDRKFGINGKQILYLPDQDAPNYTYIGSLALGDGLQNLQPTGQYNTAVGIGSMNTGPVSGIYNTGVGANSVKSITSGTFNAALGAASLSLLTTGRWNVALGSNSLSTSVSGDENTGVGFAAGQYATNSQNTFLGAYSGFNVTSGTLNTLIGTRTGWGITTGNFNTIIGGNVSGLAPGLNNTIIIADGQGQQRIYVNSSGYVGLGTTSPGSALDVKALASQPTIRLMGSTSGYVGFSVPASAGSTTYVLPSADGSNGQQLTTSGSGTLSWTSGAGTTTHTFTSSVNTITSVVNGVSKTAPAVNSVSNAINNGVLTTTVNGMVGTVTLAGYNLWGTSGTNIVNNNSTGGVIIGSVSNLTPFTNSSNNRLLVGGGIVCEKIKAALQTSANWSDYVFNKNYKLKSLSEVETYISTNNHLPDMPSADQLVNEGIDMNEMFAKQMKKIEELTLYIIDLDKQVQALKSQNEQLKKISNSNK